MRGDTQLLSAHTVRWIDIGVIVWVVVWVALGVLMWHDVRAQTQLSGAYLMRAGLNLTLRGDYDAAAVVLERM